MSLSRVAVVALASAALLLGCSPRAARRGTAEYDRAQLGESLAKGNDAALLIGEFALAPGAVVDGDTVKVEGLDASLRLLAIDTEETFKSEGDLRLYESLGFEGYLKKKGEGSNRPVKCATPVGMDAKHFAEDFFRGVTTIRLERDHPKNLRGHYERVLAYIFIERSGEWINYNVEAVRAGMSPYFSKYGYSRRFHDEFIEAQNEARAANRGIWDPSKEHYFDYDRRLRWWNGRGDFVQRFEADSEGRDDLIVLGHWDAMERLAEHEGDEVELLATVGDIKLGEGEKPTRVQLSRRMFSSFPLIFFDNELLERSRIEAAVGEFVRVRGTVTAYTYKKRRRRASRDGEDGERQLQIVVRSPAQVVTSRGLAGAGVVGGIKGGLPADHRPPAEPAPPAAQPEPETTPPAIEDEPEPVAAPETPTDEAPGDIPPPPPPPPPTPESP